jgi:anaerobic magnesium-protoporphyrin IX monomethyl ester cyclase
MHNYKILFVYPNLQMSALAPQGIGILSAIMKDNGYEVNLFDCTFYNSDPLYRPEERINKIGVRPYSYKDRQIKLKEGNMLDDFAQMVNDYAPDLLAFSVVENTWFIAEILLNSLDRRIPTLVGGVFPTNAPEIVISNKKVDYVCRGEGEKAMLDLVNCLSDGKVGKTKKIPNIWAKLDDHVYKNNIGESVDLNEIPFPDWSLFEEQSLYRPMQGKIYKTIGIETQRGCPFTCTFCNSPSNNVIYKNETGSVFYRKKSLKRLEKELTHMVELHNPEFIYFVVDTFLAMSDKELNEFAALYKSFRIPFWMNTRAETINDYRAGVLEEMNCLRINIGIEHGNPEYRQKVLGRKVTNETMLNAFRSCSGRNFVTVANSIIGLPMETRELVFDTIKFNQSLPDDIEATGAFIFTPYHGTALRKIAVEKKYIDESAICSLATTTGSILSMPQLSTDEIVDLQKFFSFYVKSDREGWGDIKYVEDNYRKEPELFDEIRKDFTEKMFKKEFEDYRGAKDLVIDANDYSDLH